MQCQARVFVRRQGVIRSCKRQAVYAVLPKWVGGSYRNLCTQHLQTQRRNEGLPLEIKKL